MSGNNHNGKRRRAVITGLGPITCIGIGREAFWKGLLAEKSGVTKLSTFPLLEEARATHAGEVRDWDPAVFFPPHRRKRLDRYAQFAVASALLALDDSGLPWSKDKPQARVGISFGTALGGIANAEAEHHKFISKGARGVNQTIALQVFGGSAHSNIAIQCGFRGIGTTNSNSCASGVIAVGEALRYIRDDMADVVIAGAAEAPLSPLTFSAFDLIKTMSRSKGESSTAYRPFDLTRDGFIMGEGACSLVIEEYEHARNRGARIYAEVVGYSLSNEAWHMTTPLPGGEAVMDCMRRTLNDAHLSPEEIDYINCHASGTQMNDSNEIACIKTVFGEHARKLAISGTKPYTAHPLGATGAMESAICAMALSESWLPPTLNFETPDPNCDLDIVPNHARRQKLGAVLNNAFGFGGINASVAMRAVE